LVAKKRSFEEMLGALTYKGDNFEKSWSWLRL